MLIWDDAYGLCQILSGDSSATTLATFKTLLNLGYKFILADLGRSVTEKIQTANTVADQRAYLVPPDFMWIKTVTYTSGTTVYPLEEEESQEMWNIRTAYNISGTPSHFFIRPRFGLGGTEILLDPRPSAVSTLTITYEAGDKDLARDKYTAGTVTATNASASLTGSGTTWIAPMTGRYFQVTSETGDGMWYRVATRSSNTAITLENVYEGVTTAALSYQIAEAFNLPEEMQILPVYYALQHFFAAKGDKTQESKYIALFNAGIQQGKLRYATKSRSNIIRPKYYNRAPSLALPYFFPSTITGS